MNNSTRITFLGHSMFQIRSKNGLRIVMDPFDENIKSELPDVGADIVTVSHSHFDHSNTEIFKDSPEIIAESGKFNKKDVKITGYVSFHDDKGGSLRGKNIIYEIEMNEMRLVHLGDFGSFGDDATAGLIGNMDILFIPVGGIYTINYNEAAELIEKLNPKIAVPMHFKERDTKLGVDEINNFRNIIKGYPIKEPGSYFDIRKEELPGETEIWIMEGCSK